MHTHKKDSENCRVGGRPLAHDSSCENANTPPSECDCSCDGDKHGLGYAEEKIHELESGTEIPTVSYLKSMTPDEYFEEHGLDTIEEAYAKVVEKIEEANEEDEINRLENDKERLENVAKVNGRELGKYVDISSDLKNFYNATKRYKAGAELLEMQIDDLETFLNQYKEDQEGSDEKRVSKDVVLTNASTLMKQLGDNEEGEGGLIKEAKILSDDEMETAEKYVDIGLIEENRERREEIEERVREIIKTVAQD